MKRFIISEAQRHLLEMEILKESYSEKVLDIKKFLDQNYKRGEMLKSKDGQQKTIGVFVQLSDKGMPTKSTMSFDDVFYRLQKERQNILPKEDRDEFLKEVIRAWYEHRINDRGSITN